LGFDTFQTNLLTIPAQAGAALTIVGMTWLSEIWDQRAFFGMVTQLWILPCVIALATLPAGSFTSEVSGGNVWNTFAVTTVLLSFPSPHAIHVSWASRNSNAVATRAISTALYNMLVQLSRVIHANIYREDDRPAYRRGNRALIGICCMNIVIYILGKLYYMWRNKTKAQKWDAMTRDVSPKGFFLCSLVLSLITCFRKKNITSLLLLIPEARDLMSSSSIKAINRAVDRHRDRSRRKFPTGQNILSLAVLIE
jgi:hypothetical protein